jgi:hypothetical protein
MKIQMMPAMTEEAPKLTKQKTKDMYLEQEDKRMDSMKKLFSNPRAARD